MSLPRRLKLQPRLLWSSRVRRDRSRCRSPRPNRSRRQRWRLRQVRRDRERLGDVAAVEVVVDRVRDRRWLRRRPQLQANYPREKHPRQNHRPRRHLPRKQRLRRSRRLKLRLLPSAPARERWSWRLDCRDRARVHGSNGTTFVRFRAICCGNFFSMTRRSSVFRIWCSPICDRC